MMKRLIVVCEGPTEKEFCRDILSPYLQSKGIGVETLTIKHSGGGIVSWRILKGQLVNHLAEGNVYVTTFIDYYGIKDEHLFPGWELAKSIPDNLGKVCHVEQAMQTDMPDSLRHRFLPHLQLHEFESLLFCDVDVFAKNFAEYELDIDQLKSVVSQFPNPEDINNSPATAPSKRIEAAVKGYSKVLFGNCIAMDIGLSKMRNCCPHFNDWISSLEGI